MQPPSSAATGQGRGTAPAPSRSSSSGPAAVGHGHEHEPLGHYLKLMGVFTGLSSAALLGLRVLGRPLPGQVPLRDVVLLGLATNRLSRGLAGG